MVDFRITAGYSCRVAVEPGQFTVPSSILLGMPTGSGSTLTQHQVVSTFSGTGLDTDGVTAMIEYLVPTTYK